MTTVSFPETTVALSGAVTQVANDPQKILVVSQKTAAGTAVSGALNQAIQADANTLAGITSMGAAVVKGARALNEDTQIDAIFIDDNGAGAASTGTFTITGPSTEAGELTFIIGSERNFSLSVAVADADTATDIGDALVAAVVVAAANGIPVTAANVAGVVTLTAENDGTEGNNISMESRGAVAGVAVVTVAMSGGATDPVLTGILDVVGETRYQTILWTWSNALDELTSFVDERFNVTDDVLDGLGYSHLIGTFSSVTTALGLLNSFIVLETFKTETGSGLEGIALIELPWVSAAYAGSLRAIRLTEGAAIADLLSGETGFDATGGPALASRPLANTPVIELVPIQPGRGWTKAEVKLIRDAGGSIIGNNVAGNLVILGEQVTTRTTDNAGNPDDSFKFVNYFDTAVGIREFYFNNLRSRYAQSRLTDGSPVAGRPMANKQNIEATCVEFFSTLAGADFVLTRSGETNRLFFKRELVVLVDLQTGDVDISMKTPVVTQLRGFNAGIQIVFNING